MGKLNLDLSGVSEDKGKTTFLPPGNYMVKAVEAEVKETAKKNGHYILFTYEVIADEYKGSTVKDFVNIINPNEDAQRIGLQRLKSIATVMGHKNPNMIEDTNDLIGKPFGITLTEREYTTNNGTFKGNDVQKVFSIEDRIDSSFNEGSKAVSPSKKPWEN